MARLCGFVHGTRADSDILRAQIRLIKARPARDFINLIAIVYLIALQWQLTAAAEPHRAEVLPHFHQTIKTAMKFIIKLFPEITIKSQSVRLRFIKILTTNIRNVLKQYDETLAVVRHWILSRCVPKTKISAR
ncbi:hypothetical protein [Serratia sp. 3ACOL1]|uniref:hypothetical protein n=1 Tax=Serratia sp. 3ACOL1 TaxID=2448483 RepID=UPI0026A65D71